MLADNTGRGGNTVPQFSLLAKLLFVFLLLRMVPQPAFSTITNNTIFGAGNNYKNLSFHSLLTINNVHVSLTPLISVEANPNVSTGVSGNRLQLFSPFRIQGKIKQALGKLFGTKATTMEAETSLPPSSTPSGIESDFDFLIPLNVSVSFKRNLLGIKISGNVSDSVGVLIKYQNLLETYLVSSSLSLIFLSSILESDDNERSKSGVCYRSKRRQRGQPGRGRDWRRNENRSGADVNTDRKSVV